MSDANKKFLLKIGLPIMIIFSILFGVKFYMRSKVLKEKQFEQEQLFREIPVCTKSNLEVGRELQEELLENEKSDSLRLKADELSDNPEKLDSLINEIKKLTNRK